ncbi:MAG: hypothetical protein LBV74_13175 [Tannerella sp.]|jgi:hypothetical protein|nr:hypothetical protein [Tannerella sp.]
MAKQKINTGEVQTASTEIQDTSVQNTTVVTVEETASEDLGDKGQKETLSKTEKPAEQPAAPSSELTPFIDDILKNHPSCETLYVDSQGGSYTPGTPARIRGKAVLYKNPWYKS